MNPPIKDNDQIRSDKDGFIDAYLKAREEFGRLENVAGVGFGRKETGDVLTPDLSITVFVLEKKPENEIRPDQRIPPTFEGYRTDVRVVPDVVPAKCDNQDRYTTIQGGIQIQARNKNSTVTGDANKGTLGCIVRKRGDDSGDNYHLLTADHALDHDDSDVGGLVYHPSAPAAGDTSSSQMIAMIESNGIQADVEFTGRRPTNGEEVPMNGWVDCAIARLDLASRCCGISCKKDNVTHAATIIDLDPGGTNNDITDVRDISLDFDMALGEGPHGTVTDANRVVKVGRTTGRTVGIVTHVNSAARAGGNIVSGFIEIAFDTSSTSNGLNCKGHALFFEGGDSGSLVLDMQRRAVGLAFGSQPRDGILRCFACHIIPVLDRLRITIPTTGGTSHGSSHATDGSGIASYGGSTSHLQDDDTVMFADHTVAGNTTVETDAPLPPAVTPSQNDHMEKWFDAIGESAAGRRLHDAYAETRLEITFLVRNKRQVTVAWHRNRGPAFLAGLLEHLRGEAPSIPKEIGGVSREAFLGRMESVLLAHGSDALKDSIACYRDDVMQCADVKTVQDCVERLRSINEIPDRPLPDADDRTSAAPPSPAPSKKIEEEVS